MVERDPETYAIIGAAMEVHRVLGKGFLEQVYHEALAFEFDQRAIPYERECALNVHYKGQRLACGYRADFICHQKVIVEIKSIDQLTRIEQAQAINYLRATGFETALLINFGQPSLQYRRLVMSPDPKINPPS